MLHHLMTDFLRFNNALRACTKCSDLFACNRVDPREGDATVAPRPIVSGIREKPVLLIGQAPGLTEYRTGKPFQGDAGQGIRAIFDELGLPRNRFDELVYSSAAMKCFPGSKPVLRGGKTREDIVPTALMLEHCRPFLEQQIELVKPKVIVTLGIVPLKRYLTLTGRNATGALLTDFVGTTGQWGGARVIFFPHTSGASRWHNEPANRALFAKAKALLREAFEELLQR